MKASVLSEMLGLLALVVMAVVALVAGPAQGLVLSKCKLKTELEAALHKMEDGSGSMKRTRKGPFSLQDFVAKMSEPEFNSTMVTVFDPSGPEDEMETADKPVAPPLSRLALQRFQGRQRAVMLRPVTPKPSRVARPTRDGWVVVIAGDDWVVVIVIQMRQAPSLATPSFDICQTPCSAVFDGIKDDKACLNELRRDQGKMKFDSALAIKDRRIDKRFSQSCAVATPDYFDECP